MADDARMVREFSPIEQRALDHVWIHSARWLDLAERDGLRVMVRGEGCRLFDAQGRSYLDGLSGLYVVNVGHGRAEIGSPITAATVSGPWARISCSIASAQSRSPASPSTPKSLR